MYYDLFAVSVSPFSIRDFISFLKVLRKCPSHDILTLIFIGAVPPVLDLAHDLNQSSDP